MDKLGNMYVFTRAVELGTFSAAAEVLSISPQSVGKFVLALENHLGVKLINRTTRHHSLTEAGRHFYDRAKFILSEVEDAESFAQDMRVKPRGHLKINAPVYFGINSLSIRLHHYLKNYPDISIELTLSNKMVDLVEEGYDAIFRVGKLSDSRLIAKSLAPYQLLTCAAPSYLSTASKLEIPRDLNNHECLIFSHSTLKTHWVFEGKERTETIPVTGRLHIDNSEALMGAAVAGCGIAMLPAELVLPYLETGQLVRVLHNYDIPLRPLNLIYAPDRRITPKLRSFIDFAVDNFG